MEEENITWDDFDLFGSWTAPKPRKRSSYIKRCKDCGLSHLSTEKNIPCPFQGVCRRLMPTPPPRRRGDGTGHRPSSYVTPCQQCGAFHKGAEARRMCEMCTVCGEFHEHTPDGATECPPCRTCYRHGCSASKCECCVLCGTDTAGPASCPYCPLCGRCHSDNEDCRCHNCHRGEGHGTRNCPHACRNCHQWGHGILSCPSENPCKHCGQVGHHIDLCDFMRNPCANCGRTGHNIEMCRAPCLHCHSSTHVSFQCTAAERRAQQNSTRQINRKLRGPRKRTRTPVPGPKVGRVCHHQVMDMQDQVDEMYRELDQVTEMVYQQDEVYQQEQQQQDEVYQQEGAYQQDGMYQQEQQEGAYQQDGMYQQEGVEPDQATYQDIYHQDPATDMYQYHAYQQAYLQYMYAWQAYQHACYPGGVIPSSYE